MTKKGYSRVPTWKLLTDPDDNADEDSADGVHVKTGTLRPSAGAFLTKRCIIGKRMSYGVRSGNPCVKETEIVIYNGRSYKYHVCKTHSLICNSLKCEDVISYSPALRATYTSGCRCKG